MAKAKKRSRFSVNISRMELESIQEFVKGSNDYTTVSDYCIKAVQKKLKLDLSKINKKYPIHKSIRRFRVSPITQNDILTYLIKDQRKQTVREISEGLGHDYSKVRISNMHTTINKLVIKGYVTKSEDTMYVKGRTKSKFDRKIHTLEYLMELHEKYGTNEKAGKFLGISKGAFRRWTDPQWRANHTGFLQRKVIYYSLDITHPKVIFASIQARVENNGKRTRFMTGNDKASINSFITYDWRTRGEIIKDCIEVLDLTDHQIKKHIASLVKSGKVEKNHTLKDGRLVVYRWKE